jgi:hypothetical protein
MERVFECDFTPTVRKSADRIRKMSSVRTVLLILITVAYPVYILPQAVGSIIFYGFSPEWLIFALLSILLPAYGIFMPEINGYFYVRQFKKQCSSYHIIFGDSIEIHQGNIKIIWDYAEINRAVRLKYHYELQKDKRIGIMFDPETMTGGTFEEFKQFLREKRSDLVIPN